jgi:3-oxoacyl-[acyl-carrier-protein] synthase II
VSAATAVLTLPQEARARRPHDAPTSTAAIGGDVQIVASSLHLPGRSLAHLIDGADDRAYPADGAHELLGRRGLLGKQPVTKLALCAVHRALGMPSGARCQGAPDPRVAVVASSNLGNVAAVRGVIGALDQGGLRAVSALDAPNASSNVLATSIAIWFRFGGPNFLVASGATSGLDAVALGCLLLRTRRADRVVVVGAEPDDPVAQSLHAVRRGPSSSSPLVAGAAAVVLQRASVGAPRPICVTVGSRSRVAPIEVARTVSGMMLGPSAVRGADPVVDLAHEIGDTYGALGVMQVAVAAALIRSGTAAPPRVTIVSGDAADGWRVGAVGALPVAAGELGAERSES